jgi:thiamine-monophosphate kinase
LGEASAKGPVSRSGARPGDWIFVTGPLGGSILGKHLDFTPRVREALLLHEIVDLRAMIDVSDGLAADVAHLCHESGCGAVLRADSIPISPAARQLAERSGRTPLEHALSDGEDFELAFAVSPDDGRRIAADQPVEGIRLSHIGEMATDGYWLEQSGARRPLEPKGYVHALGVE